MRKKIYYMDLLAIENGECHTRIQHLVKEAICTTKDWDRLIFWMDIELALALLNHYERRSFVLNFIEGFTEKEIARRHKVTQQAVSKQLKKARKIIRNFLKEAYGTP